MMIQLRAFVFFATALFILGCEREPSFQTKTSTNGPLFSAVPASHSNINFINKVKQDNDFNCVRYTYALIGGGVAVGDVDNNGLDDVYLTSNQESNKLYLNQGNFVFEDITSKSGTEDLSGWSTGTNMIDINNDGWMDIYVCKSASVGDAELRRNKLFVNQKNGTFKEEAKNWGLDHNGFSIQSYFFDYDLDGDLDMYLVNHRPDFENTLRIEPKEKQKFYPETSDQLFRNDGNFFTNVTQQAKLINKAWGLSASIGDFNNDGWPDIYVANDYIAPDYLYINRRDGTFSNQINTRLKHISYNSMGSDFADINNDFLADLIVLEMSSEDHVRSKENMPTMNTESFKKIVASDHHYPYMSNVLQMNNGNGSFSDIGQMAGISKTDWSWAPLIADFDNDGHKDLLVTNGIERNFSNQDYIRKVKKNLEEDVAMTVMEVIEMMPSEKLANYIYKNNADLTFSNKTKEWGLGEKLNSNGVAYSDLDNDGDLDLVMNNMSDKASIYKNNSIGNFINIKLKGPQNNSLGLGAKIKVYTKEKEQQQELFLSRGYQSSMSPTLNFGLGNEQTVSKIEVDWANGRVSTLENILGNQTIDIPFPSAQSGKASQKKVVRNIVPTRASRLGVDFKHEENDFNDFALQVLLPQKQSQQGPSLVVADVNNDGLEDFFVGGALGQSGKLYVQSPSGKFEPRSNPSFEKDKIYEDVSALFFDMDNDGDKDLYVCSGGYELAENNYRLQDRLYENNGEGIFTKTTNLPNMYTNTKSVASIDFDSDGDLDLFVGGHVVPGKYPLGSTSYLLENKNGSFTNATSKYIPDLEEIGFVKDLLVTDMDNDKDDDLVVVGEWMPITFFENENGVFSKKNITGLEKTSGWWNTIVEIDLNHDGLMDYLVGNLGENNKFHPTDEKPLHIYGNYFDENNTYDMVMSKLYKGKQVPIRGKECSTEQNPFVSQRIKTFKEFANSSLMEIYGEQELNVSYHKEAHIFSSMALYNKGDGSFEQRRLPSIAQAGPTLAFGIADVNNDGLMDILGIGAIHETEVETIRYDANIGYILIGTEKGRLEPYKDLNFYLGNNSKNVEIIAIGNNNFALVANNNGPLEFFKL